MTYTYDMFDRRIAKSVDFDGSGAGLAVVERYVYDRDHIMLVLSGLGILKERYLYGANLDQVLAVEGSQVSWTLSDYLGTVRDLVSSAGVVQKHIKYDSFGNVTAQSAPLVKSRFGFTGREFDSETGLYYYRSRYYDSAVGRFISEDRIGFAGGDANLYRYVGNSATNAIDPFGLWTIIYIFSATSGGVSESNPFGHTAIAINGTYYNFNKEGLDRSNGDQFYMNYSLVGVPIRRYQLDFSKDEEDKIAAYLDRLYFNAPIPKKNGIEQRARPLPLRDYDLSSNNCTTVTIEALRETRVEKYIRHIIEPFELERKLIDWSLGVRYGWRGNNYVPKFIPPVKTIRLPDYTRQQ
ncbi:RHS repeat domain-containing protein [Tumidithrix helvetica]|uniref:RHS repeat domain-containing protein n=1 Tax=Tumidithrix helvetica TaxID=3457545 RepID=UPI003CC68499